MVQALDFDQKPQFYTLTSSNNTALTGTKVPDMQ